MSKLLSQLKAAAANREATGGNTQIVTTCDVRDWETFVERLAEALDDNGVGEWKLLERAIRNNASVAGAFQRMAPKPKVTLIVYTTGKLVCQNGDARKVLEDLGLGEYII